MYRNWNRMAVQMCRLRILALVPVWFFLIKWCLSGLSTDLKIGMQLIAFGSFLIFIGTFQLLKYFFYEKRILDSDLEERLKKSPEDKSRNLC
jgi:hypothetical protein